MQETELLGRYKFLALFVFFIFFTPSKGSAQVHPNPEIQKLITTGIDNLINQEFHKARISFSTLQKKYPQNPLGKIFLAATEIFIAFDNQLPYDDNKILDWLNDAITISEQLIETNKNNAWYNYYKGLAEGYKADYFSTRESWFSAVTTAYSAKQYFDRCLSIDSTFYDAYVSLGAFKYWSSEKTEFLSWLPFLKDERETASKLLLAAISKHSFHSHLAVHNMVWIYFKKKEYQKAKEILEPFIQKYPHSRFFKWDLAKLYEETDKSKAIRIYWEIYDSYDKAFVKNRCNDISLKFILAKNYSALGDRKTAAKLVSEIPYENQLTPYEIEKLGSRLDRIHALREELQKNSGK